MRSSITLTFCETVAPLGRILPTRTFCETLLPGYDIVPDMPDGLIAATALHLQAPLLTRDNQIRLASLQTIW